MKQALLQGRGGLGCRPPLPPPDQVHCGRPVGGGPSPPGALHLLRQPEQRASGGVRGREEERARGGVT